MIFKCIRFSAHTHNRNFIYGKPMEKSGDVESAEKKKKEELVAEMDRQYVLGALDEMNEPVMNEIKTLIKTDTQKADQWLKDNYTRYDFFRNEAKDISDNRFEKVKKMPPHKAVEWISGYKEVNKIFNKVIDHTGKENKPKVMEGFSSSDNMVYLKDNEAYNIKIMEDQPKAAGLLQSHIRRCEMISKLYKDKELNLQEAKFYRNLDNPIDAILRLKSLTEDKEEAKANKDLARQLRLLP